MTAFGAELPDGSRETFVLRQHNAYDPHSAAREFRLLRLLEEAGLPVPPPVHLEPERNRFVANYLEGRPEASPTDVPGFLDRYATMLARIHGTDLSRFDLSFLPPQSCGYGPRRTEPNETMRETEVRNALESLSPIVRSNPPVLRHGDFWPGNVLWQDGEISGVIDWEEALVGEPLADLAIARLDLLWILGLDAMDGFTERYQTRTDLNLTDLPYWDLCASLRPMPNLHEWAPNYPGLGRSDVTEATMHRDHATFVERALRHI